MKRFLWSLVFLLVLTGCSSLVPSEYFSVTPHTDSSEVSVDTDVITAENYLSLKNAILSLVRSGQTEGVIRVTNYDGDVNSDLTEAAYEVCKQDPLGAYAVDYMTHTCTQIVSYYEIRVFITFRRSAEEIAQIQSVSTQYQLQEKLQSAIDSYSSRLTLRLSNYQEQDIPSLVGDYCSANPAAVMETPAVSVSVYPESGTVRILEINFSYTHTPEELKAMQIAVQQSIDAAAEYIRYRETGWDKLQLLFPYLMERFQYREAETVTPLYDALCSGIADSTGLAQAWQLICDQSDVTCYTVSGMRDGDACSWNIVDTGGVCRHLDLQRCILQLGQLALWTDSDMASYSWNTEQYPSCQSTAAAAEAPAENSSQSQVPETAEVPAEAHEADPGQTEPPASEEEDAQEPESRENAE